MEKFKVFLALSLSIVFLFALAGCGGSDTSETSPTATSSLAKETASPAQNTVTVKQERNQVTLPLTDDKVGFTMWVSNTEIFDGFNDFYDSVFFKNMEDRTGVYMDFLHPVTGSQSEHFNLIIASQDFPDFMVGFASYYPYGLEQAVEEDVIVALNEYIGIMPDYYYYCTRTEEIAKQSVTDSGYLWAFHYMTDNPQGCYRALGIRQDWLDDDGLEKPTTIAEMEEVLKSFKENHTGGHGPLSLLAPGTSREGSLIGSYNTIGTNFGNSKGFLNIDGKAVFGPLEKGFYDYLVQMHDWWNKGLIFEEFTANTSTYQVDQEDVVLDRVGIFDYTFTYSSSWKAVSEDPDFRIVALTTPRLNDKMEYSDIHVRLQKQTIRPEGSTVMMSSCKEREIAVKYWNYEFTDEGILLSNYGIEGDTFTYDANGNPVYTEKFLSTGDGNISYAQKKYLARDIASYFIYRRETVPLTQDQKDAEAIWGLAGAEYLWPENATMTADENTEFANIFSDIKTYCEEAVPKFIDGTFNLQDDFDAFVNRIYDMNIERCIELKQASLDRFWNREWKR